MKEQTYNLPKKVLSLLTAAALVCTIIPAVGQVNARSVSDIQKEIQQKEKEKNAASAHAHELGQKATGIQGEINVLTDQIASIQSQIDLNTARQAELTKEIEAAQQKLEEQKELLSANIRSMYIEGDISPLEMIASSKNLSDFMEKQEYRDRLRESITGTMDEIERLRKELDDQRKEVARILDEQKSLRGDLDQKNGEATGKLRAVNRDKATFDAEVRARQGDITKLQREIQAIQAALSRVDPSKLPSSGYVSRGTVVGTVGNTGNSFGSHLHLRAQLSNGVAVNPRNYLGSRWSWPLANIRVTQEFGENPWQYGYGAAGHDGIDFGAPSGTPIMAVEDGTLYKGWSTQLLGYWHLGCMALIRHNDGLLSIYAHMEERNC